MTMCDFLVGQKVVCIYAEFSTGPHHAGLVEGKIYEVEFVKVSSCGLAQILVDDSGGLYIADRFRPVIDRKTDISLFKAMLAPYKAGIDA
jgi:hypothetical protein